MNPAVVASAAVTDATISTSDITTNNASTAKHGWLKKLSNVATEYMDGTGAWSTPPVTTDATLTTTDVTTNNATTAKHGFLKKLSNVATEYMDGTGAWSTPTSGITQQVSTTTSGSSVVFTLTETYKVIECILVGVSSSSSATIGIELSSDGGSSYGSLNAINTAGTGNYAGFIKISHTGVTSTDKRIFSACSLNSASYSSGALGFNSVFTESTATGVINRIRFSVSAGSFDNGEIVVIGYT
jgi:hypothetical protein